MRLVPVFAEDLGNAQPSSPLTQLPAGAVAIDAATQRLMGIRVAAVEKSRRHPHRPRNWPGGSRRHACIQDQFWFGWVHSRDLQRFGGNAGQEGPEAGVLYSPDILAVASGFLAASERVPGAVGNDGNRTMPFPGTLSKQGVSSMQGYTDRLRNLGMSDVQIKRMADLRQLPESIDIVAPADGSLFARNISPGQHFDHEMEFYRLAI